MGVLHFTIKIAVVSSAAARLCKLKQQVPLAGVKVARGTPTETVTIAEENKNMTAWFGEVGQGCLTPGGSFESDHLLM